MSNWDKYERGIERGPASAAWSLGKIAIIFGIVAIIVIAAVGFIWKPFDVVRTVTQTDKMIYNYEYFYNQAEAYRAIKQKIATAQGSVERFTEAAGPRTDWSFEDKTEYARLASIADGLIYQCNDIVAEYNARAQQATRSIFKTNDTPYQLGACN